MYIIAKMVYYGSASIAIFMIRIVIAAIIINGISIGIYDEHSSSDLQLSNR